MAYAQRDYAGANAYLNQALALDRQLGNHLGEAQGLGNLGVVAYAQGDHVGAKVYLEQSAQLYQEIGVAFPPGVQSVLDALTKQP